MRYRFTALIWPFPGQEPVPEMGIVYAVDRPEAFDKARQVAAAMGHAARLTDLHEAPYDLQA